MPKYTFPEAFNTTSVRPGHNGGARRRMPPRQCPQCRGKFPVQPMKNRTLERLIDEVKFEFPCR